MLQTIHLAQARQPNRGSQDYFPSPSHQVLSSSPELEQLELDHLDQLELDQVEQLRSWFLGGGFPGAGGNLQEAIHKRGPGFYPQTR